MSIDVVESKLNINDSDFVLIAETEASIERIKLVELFTNAEQVVAEIGAIFRAPESAVHLGSAEHAEMAVFAFVASVAACLVAEIAVENVARDRDFTEGGLGEQIERNKPERVDRIVGEFGAGETLIVFVCFFSRIVATLPGGNGLALFLGREKLADHTHLDEKRKCGEIEMHAVDFYGGLETVRNQETERIHVCEIGVIRMPGVVIMRQIVGRRARLRSMDFFLDRLGRCLLCRSCLLSGSIFWSNFPKRREQAVRGQKCSWQQPYSKKKTFCPQREQMQASFP